MGWKGRGWDGRGQDEKGWAWSGIVCARPADRLVQRLEHVHGEEEALLHEALGWGSLDRVLPFDLTLQAKQVSAEVKEVSTTTHC